MRRVMLECNVLESARSRIRSTFAEFGKIYVSFSGGKDSSVMMHLVCEEARKLGMRVAVLFIDWECQFTHTINHVEQMLDEYKDCIDPYWYQLPITTWNGCSQFEPEWTAWDESKQDLWVRQKSKLPFVIKSKDDCPFYYDGITFEEFTTLFASWYGGGEKCAAMVGIRTAESLNRFRTIARRKPMYNGWRFSTNVTDDVWNIYPIYDWKASDIWTFNCRFKKSYNKLYDRMHQAGMTVHQMRIDEPFGDTQRQSLWLYQIVEPDLWSKMVSRVAGANIGSLYGEESGNILGNRSIYLPKGHTWKSFANLLLDTMPPKTSTHYKNKIAVYLQWYKTRGYPEDIPDQADYKMETYEKAPSWRRICKVLLRNDYWCRGLGFSPTKSQAYDKYLKLMKRRRDSWGIFNDDK